MRFKIIFKQIKFDRNLQIGTEAVAIGKSDVGCYQWIVNTTISDGMKIIIACNFNLSAADVERISQEVLQKLKRELNSSAAARRGGTR